MSRKIESTALREEIKSRKAILHKPGTIVGIIRNEPHEIIVKSVDGR
jgi:hypothetical protein